MPLPVIVICGEAGSGKSTLSNKLATVTTIVNEVEQTLKCLSLPPSSTLSSVPQTQSQSQSPADSPVSTEATPTAIVVPFVMYTQQSRTYMAQRLMALPDLVSSVKFVWLKLDEQIHQQRNEGRVEKWAAIGIRMHPNDVVNLTKSLTKNECLDDCLVIDNSVRSDIEHTLQTIVDFATTTATSN